MKQSKKNQPVVQGNKILLYNWAYEGRVTDLLKEFGYEHNKFMENKTTDDYLGVVDQFVKRGIAVMVKQSDDGLIIYLDTSRFGQR